MAEYIDLSRADAAAALDVLEHAQQTKRHAEVQEALAMLRVAHTYRHPVPTDKIRLGGDGTPSVDDYACLELAAALHRSVDSVTPMVTELLNLETRLPQLWETTVGCGAPLWLARKVARLTGDLSLAKALWVDAAIAPFVTRLSPTRLLRFVEALVVQADPDAANARWEGRSQPAVKIGGLQRDGLRDIYGWLAAADATFLDAALNQLSGVLAGQGSTEPADVRRATALGILATPARALAMIQQSVAQPALTDPADTTAPISSLAAADPASDNIADTAGVRSPAHCTGHTCGTITVEPHRLLPKTTLIVHLSDQTLLAGEGVGRCDRLGPVTVQQIRRLLADSQVTVRPVFNPNGIVPVDSYEVPDSIRRATLLRHPYEIWPYGTAASAGLDLDHTDPWRAGRKGQTRPDNLGPLRRKAHRAKTHAGWSVTQPTPGTFVWRSPLGRRYVVTPSGLTNDYQRPPGSYPWEDPVGGPLLPALPPTQPMRPSRNRRRRAITATKSTRSPVLRR